MARKLSVAIVVALLGGVLVPVATATSANAASSAGLNYVLDENNNATITGCVDPCATDLTIPNTVDGYVVTDIGPSAFANHGITDLHLPNSLKTIGAMAFRFNAIHEVTMPASLTSIGANSFEGNYLSLLFFSGSANTPGLNIGTEAFSNNSLTIVNLPYRVTGIADGVFNQNALSQVTLLGNQTLPSDANNLFTGNTDLKCVRVQESATGWGTEFSGIPICEKQPLTYKIYGSEIWITGCLTTCPSDLVIVGKIDGYDVTTIEDYAFYNKGLNSVDLPASVTTLRRAVFANNNLTSFTGKDGLTFIGREAFRRNYNLLSVSLPASLSNIENSAFADASALTDVMFNGEPPYYTGSPFYNDGQLTTIHALKTTKFWGETFAGVPVALVGPTLNTTVPSPPTDVFVSRQSMRAIVAWSAPADSGGIPIIGYTATATPGGQTCNTQGELTCTFDGLNKNITYTFSVVAINSLGSSIASATSQQRLTHASQSIEFSQLVDQSWSQLPFTVTATSYFLGEHSATGLDVTFTSMTPLVCSIEVFAVTKLKSGICTIRASQSGDEIFSAADPVNISFQILKAQQTPLEVQVNSVTNNGATTTPISLNLSNASNPLSANVFKVFDVDSGGTASVNLQQLSAITSSTTPLFAVLAADTARCSVDEKGIVNILDVGDCRVEVKAPANDYYLASGQQLATDTVGAVTVWINTTAFNAGPSGATPPVDTGGSEVDDTFKSAGDTAPALSITTNPRVPATLNYGSGFSIAYDPSGKITPLAQSRYVGSLTYVMSFSDRSKSFDVLGCPLKKYRDKAKKICKNPRLIASATCTVTATKKKTGYAFKKMEQWTLKACQINATGRAKLIAENVALRPKVVVKMDFKRLFPENGKIQITRSGKVHKVTNRKSAFVIKFG